MSNFKLFWTIHKWVGIVAALIVCVVAVTGFMLLIKKNVEWIQPPTQRGTAGNLSGFVSLDAAYRAVLRLEHPAFTDPDDLDRVDVRPGKSVYKFQSVHDYAEVQVCAVTGVVLGNVEIRRSDLIENIHDGSFVADWVHAWVMPAVAVSLVVLAASGLWLWIEPMLRRRRRRRTKITYRG